MNEIGHDDRQLEQSRSGSAGCARSRDRRRPGWPEPPPPRQSSRPARPGVSLKRVSASVSARGARPPTPGGRPAAAAAARVKPSGISRAGVASIAPRRNRPTASPGPTGPTAMPVHQRRPGCRHQRQSEQAEPAVDQHDGGRQRLGAGGLRRVGDPDDVAADVAGQEVVEEGRDEKRLGQEAEGKADVLGAQQHAPAHGAGQHHHQIEPERRHQPGRRRLARDAPQTRDVHPRKQQREQRRR